MNAIKPNVVSIDQKSSETQPKARRGAAQMREAADQVMERDSHQIAEALSTNSKKGQIQSAKFLYQLSEKKEQFGEGEGSRKFRSIAMELANSPEWTETSPATEEDQSDVEN
jgi:hypothetical protein